MVRSAALYLVLVGVPVAGMSAVLQAGRGLKPPASFGGSWRMEIWPDSLCFPSQPDTLQLIIEQSGPSLRIGTPSGSQFEGRVVGEGFVAGGRNQRRIGASRVWGTRGSEFEGTVAGVPCEAAINTRIRATRLHLPGDLTGH